MKQTKQRVIAIDYFRGLCMLIVLLDHSSLFSMPLPYLVGAGRLWTGAAELFFLLSGLTFGVVRSRLVVTDFKAAVLKSWRRAGFLYLLNTIIISISIILALFLVAGHHTNDVVGSLPAVSGFSLLGQILSFSYSIGWANFLMYYSVYLLMAPFALYAIKTRFWPLVPMISYAVYSLNTTYPFHHMPHGAYSSFATWQLYFVLGLVLARFRVPLIRRFYSLPARWLKLTTNTILIAAGSLIAIDGLANFNFLPILNRLALAGWLPIKAVSGYIDLLHQKAWLDGLLMNGRTGLLRPVATLFFLATLYILYQRYSRFLLERTGRFVNAMGRDTLWIFVAQALLIPILAALPVPRQLSYNLMLSFILFYSLWALTKRQSLKAGLSRYTLQLKEAFYEAKSAALDHRQDDAKDYPSNF
ncbi:MAG TPA: OpgC domain-containing protein [Candidatus Saccharimonadales bacterium]|nr:OpgC domain-containing protein [Candidatus Saccharimonadales bacterium]